MTGRQARIRSERNTQRNQQATLRILAGIALIIVVGWVLLWLAGKISSAMIEVETVQSGELEQAASVPAIILKQERILVAPSRGRLENLVAEGERVKNGTEVARFYPEGAVRPISIIVPSSGIASFQLDGWEEKLTGFSLTHGDKDVFDYKPRVLNDGSFEFDSGEPILKVVDNLAPLKVAILLEPLDDFKPIKVEDSLTLKCGDGEEYEAQCTEAWTGSGRQVIILTVSRPADTLLNQRCLEVECISRVIRGIIVPQDSLVKTDSSTGIFKVYNDKVQFQKVEVKAEIGEQAVVKGLNAGDLIVTTPGLVKEGMRYD